MAVTGADAVPVIDHDGPAVPAHGVYEGDQAIGRGDDLCAEAATDVDAAMKRAFTVKRVNAFAETAGDLAVDGPEIRGGVGLDPVSGRDVAGQAHGQADHGCTA